jgi:hypothetical protein
MTQIFHRSTNTVAKASIFGGVFLLGGGVALALALSRSPYVTKQGLPQNQPIPFSHVHHVAGIGVDCRYCHTSVEKAAVASIPGAKTCMNCHSQIWKDSPVLEPVRASFRNNTAIQWTKVNDLPDFVYFNHSAHVNKGVGCTTCHGRVDQMPLMVQAQPLTMEWCLDCHRDPAKYVRPKEEVFNVAYEPPADQDALGRKLVAEYHINTRTSCSTCHR